MRPHIHITQFIHAAADSLASVEVAVQEFLKMAFLESDFRCDLFCFVGAHHDDYSEVQEISFILAASEKPG